MTGPDHFEHRVTRLEESQLFADRAVDELGDALREVLGAVGRLEARLTKLEARLEQVASDSGQQDPGLEPPPHSAGPDICRDPL